MGRGTATVVRGVCTWGLCGIEGADRCFERGCFVSIFALFFPDKFFGFLSLFMGVARSENGKRKKEIKLKSAVQLQEFLDIVRAVFAEDKGVCACACACACVPAMHP